jgi:cytoskeletal protein CcmA (bactofilin family)
MRVIPPAFAAFAFLLIPAAWAQAPYADPKTAAGWAWKEIRNGKIADFDERCGDLDPHAKARWDDPCRKISPQFLVDVLTMPKWRDRLPQHRLALRRAFIDGTIDLSRLQITPELSIEASRIEGDLVLADSRWERPLILLATALTGKLSAWRMRSASTLIIRDHCLIEGNVDLTVAKIDGNLEMETSDFAGAVTGDSLSVGQYLLMRDGATFGENINLVGVKVGRNLEMTGATFSGDVHLDVAKVGGDLWMASASFGGKVTADSLNVETDLLMHDHATFSGDLRLQNAKIGGNLNMGRFSSFKSVNANFVKVAKNLWMSEHATFNSDVNLDRANIGGDVRMDSSSFGGKVSADSLNVEKDLVMSGHAAFAGHVYLPSAKVGGSVYMNSASFGGQVSAVFLNVGNDLQMRDHAAFSGDVDLDSAKVGGDVRMDSSSFGGEVNADSLNVEKDLWMSDHATFTGDIDLESAKIGGNLEMDTSSFFKALKADSLSVGKDLLMDHSTFSGKVDLDSAKIIGTLGMNSSSFSNTVYAGRVNVGKDLLMQDHAVFRGNVGLTAANVGSNINMNRSSFTNPINAGRLNVGGDLFMAESAVFQDSVNMGNAKIGNSFDLRGATVAYIDLSGADVQELLMVGLKWWNPGGKDPISAGTEQSSAGNSAGSAQWRPGDPGRREFRCGAESHPKVPTLVLCNTHVGAFQDSANAWPPAIVLEGFHYDRLGGRGANGSNDMGQRLPEDWNDWLNRDPTFSTQPYTQLSSVLLADGHREVAEAIQFDGRERERREMRRDTFSSWLYWSWLTVFSIVAGYGVGLYTFRVLWWVIGLTVLGAVVLRYSSYARRRGFVWRLGASLHRLLPIVELSNEFNDFFENSSSDSGESGERRNLNRFQVAYFVGQAIAGWILGFFLLAAMGTLTGKG